MAKVYVVTRPGLLFKVFYTIEQTVGRGCPNQTDDVALVQFFLRAVMEDDKKYKIPDGGPLSIDGICGPQTIQHIQSWQEQENKIADPLNRPPLDGQISAAVERHFRRDAFPHSLCDYHVQHHLRRHQRRGQARRSV